MDVHQNACLTPKGREAMVRAVIKNGLSMAQAARSFNTTAKTVAKWVHRFRERANDGLRDRSSRPHVSPRQTPPATADAVERLRRQRLTQEHIARHTGLSKATISRILKRRGLSLLSALEPKQQRPRYERETPGEIIHIDIKRLVKFNKIGHRITGDTGRPTKSRGIGWEFAHVAIDDHSRVARIDILPDEKATSAVAFLNQTIDYYRSLGVKVSRVMTDNGACYTSLAFRGACNRRGIKHIRTKPYTPQTNGKAERFIQTALREWAYVTAYHTSMQRRDALPTWLHRYNWHRPHASIGQLPPISRLGLTRNNLLRHHT